MKTQLYNEIEFNVNGLTLSGNLIIPETAIALVIFSHGSGSSRFSPRNNFVSSELNRHGLATLLVDLLTPAEDAVYENRFDIALLTQRLIAITNHFLNGKIPHISKIGYFGASTGAASALLAAAALGHKIGAVVSRGGRPDLALPEIGNVKAPTLLIVGGDDFKVIELNEIALRALNCEKKLQIIPGATHLFEEPGTLEQVAYYASKWFNIHLNKIHA